MSRRVAGNVLCNWTGMLVSMGAGFLVAPYLVHRLGDTVYGLWILIASMSGYFGLLDLGVRGSIGRYVAYYQARGEQQNVNATLSTSVALLLGVALLAVLATGVVMVLFFRIFDVPPEHVHAARLALLIVGINLALTFPVSAFDGLLWGMERFDLLNAVDIPTTVIRTMFTFWLVRGPDDILALAWITLISTAGNELAKFALSFYVNPGLRVSAGRFSRAQAKLLYGYGIWQFLLQICRQVSSQIGPLVIGSIITVAAVTPFSIASRLIGYASHFMVAATGVLTPLATALHAHDEVERERQLFIEGGKWCTAFALLAGVGLLGLGKPLIELWMGKPLAASSVLLLVILTCGEMLAMSQWLSYSILLGKAKHRAVAIASLAEGIIAAVGGTIAARHWGVPGVCVVFALTGFSLRGVFQVMYACRVLGVPVASYLPALVRPLLTATPPAAVLASLVWWHSPATWVEFVGYAIGFALIYVAVVFPLLGGLKYLPKKQVQEWSMAAVEKV